MKINAKLFLLTFTIITFVSVASAFIYHTLAQQLLQSQQNKALVNSANDFIFAFQELIEKADEDFKQIDNLNSNIDKKSNLDFAFEIGKDSSIVNSRFHLKEKEKIYTDVTSLSDFLDYNTDLITRRAIKSGKEFYFGFRIDNEILKKMSEKIRAEIALVEENVVSKFTNDNANLNYLPYLSRVSRELKSKNNFELIHETMDDEDISATHYSPKSSVYSKNKIDFIIFSISQEASTFKDTMNLVTALTVISGIFLTIIFLFVFTAKFRKQLDYITKGVQNIAAGNLNERVRIISTDEIGNLGNAFNDMLNEIEKRDISEKEYAEFIGLINQNPTLEEIGKVTLQKIINLTKVDVGAFYLHSNNELIPFAADGVQSRKHNLLEDSSFFNRAMDKKELVEIHFEENFPIIKTGITELKINYLFILPIFYNNELIAILELASVNKPTLDLKIYLNKIKNQLAIGIANGRALSDLKSMVGELQNLNKAYQEQNIEITEKNDELIKLHEKLKRGSKELEIQTTKAVESEKIKSQFLANMSHELRTPQNSILGLTELILKDETITAKTKERLNVVLRNGKKLLTLIENILDYSKLESGNTEIKKTNIKLSELTDEVTSFLNPLFLEREIDFRVETPTTSDFVLEADTKKVEQIIYNLVGNAAKFTKMGYVKLDLSISDSDLKIRVEDTGPGISDSDKQIIFDEFRQADANLNRKFSGTGLGLAICKRYSELMGGTITVSNRKTNGSIFEVKLPDIVKTEIVFSPNDYLIANSKQKMKALIISDGADSIDLIRDYLESHKILVEVRNSNKIDVNIIEGINPDIIVLDILFGEKNGWDLLLELKTKSSLENVPVIVVNMDEEANCGLGLNIYKYYADEITKLNVHKAVEKIEEQQSIKFRKLLFIMNDDNYTVVEDELISDELKTYHHNGKGTPLDIIKKYEPDLIIVDLLDENIDSVKTLSEVNNDLYSKSIPVVAFLNKADASSNHGQISNSLFETTLQWQFHPLDVLKVIKDRIELFDSSIFEENHQTSETKFKTEIPNTNSSKQTSGKIKILIVDDDNDARFTIGEIVESLGYQPIFATNGFECLDKLNVELPDLVLLDIMMPKMDGFQTIKKIREIGKYDGLDVFALTAYAMLKDKGIVEKNGFDGLFTKPINTAQLERKLNQIFNVAR